MVFRRDNKADAFQRQISALRHQLGSEEESPAASAPASGTASDADDARTMPVDNRPLVSTSFGSQDARELSFGGYGGSPEASYSPGEGPADAAPDETPVIDARTSVIAVDAVWTGNLECDGAIHVHGRMDGSLTSKEDIYIAEEALVDAKITAQNVLIAGRVKGSITCHGRFEALPQGRVSADIQAPALIVHEGASITGQFRMGIPEAAVAVTPAAAPTAVVHRRSARG